MLNIYARTFITATRTGCVRLRDMPVNPPAARRRWFLRPKTRCIDPAKL